MNKKFIIIRGNINFKNMKNFNPNSNENNY